MIFFYDFTYVHHEVEGMDDCAGDVIMNSRMLPPVI